MYIKETHNIMSRNNIEHVFILYRSWLEAANNEKCLRGPYCFIEHYNPIDICILHEKEWINSLNKIKEPTIKPSIGFFFLPVGTSSTIRGIKNSLIIRHKFGCLSIHK